MQANKSTGRPLLEIFDFGLALAPRQPAPRFLSKSKTYKTQAETRGFIFCPLGTGAPRCIFLFIIKNNVL